MQLGMELEVLRGRLAIRYHLESFSYDKLLRLQSPGGLRVGTKDWCGTHLTHFSSETKSKRWRAAAQLLLIGLFHQFDHAETESDLRVTTQNKNEVLAGSNLVGRLAVDADELNVAVEKLN